MIYRIEARMASGIQRSAGKLIFNNDIKQVYSIRCLAKISGIKKRAFRMRLFRYLAKVSGIRVSGNWPEQLDIAATISGRQLGIWQRYRA